MAACPSYAKEVKMSASPKDATPQPGVPAKSQTLWGKEEQGSERSFRRKAETEMSGLCDDARTICPTTPPRRSWSASRKRWMKFWQCWPSVRLPSGSGFCSMRCMISAMRRLVGGAAAPRPQSMRASRAFGKSFSNFSADHPDDHPGMMATR